MHECFHVNTTGRRIYLVMVAGVSGVGLWYLMRSGSADHTPEHKAAVPSAMEHPVSPSNHKAAQSPPEFGSPEFNKYALDRMQKWLASRDRDAASLVAAWDVTGDENLLDEAAQKFPNDPRVCVAMINRLGANEKALPWVERLITREPGNPSGLYWKAQILAGSKKPEEALAALRAATATKGKPDSHLRDRMVTVREAALASGATLKEAAMVAILGPVTRNGVPEIGGGTMRLMREQIEAAKKTGDLERVADIASLGAASAEHLGLSDAPILMNELIRQSVLQAMLKELDPQTEFGTGGKTVAERLTEVQAESDAIKTLFKPNNSDTGFDFLNQLTDAQTAEYTDHFILHGEWSAMKWRNALLERLPK